MGGIRFVGALFVALAAAACEGRSPAAPDNPAAAATGLAIAGADALLTSTASPYTATATLPDGTTRTVTPVWTSSDPAVAAIDPAGRLEARTHGTITLRASYAGRDAAKQVQVVNNYGGRWTGEYVIASCQDTGDLTDHDGGFCHTWHAPGTVYPITIDMTQDPGNPGDVVARFWDATWRGSVGTDGRLTLAGMNDVRDWDGDVVGAQEIRWDTNLSAPGAMSGRFEEDYKSIVFRVGTARMRYEPLIMTRAAAGTR